MNVDIQSEEWKQLTAAAYEQAIEFYLRPNPLMEKWKRDHDEWWAKQSRWFKVRYRCRNWRQGKSYDIRRAIADRIFPEGKDYQ